MKSNVSVLLIVVAVSVSGCVRPSECAWTETIYLTPNDADVISDDLANGIIGHNESREANCP